jgi:lysozyme
VQARNPNNSRGIDVSRYQGNIDWQRVKSAGISFVFVKATQGETYVDPMFKANIYGAKAAGLFVGAYHFLKASTAGAAVAEADNFIRAVISVGGFSMLDFPPVVDVEDSANTPEAARAWIQRMESVAGVKPIVYTYPSFIDFKLGDSLSDCPLWYADYSHYQPEDRGGWTEWTFLQYSEHGYVPGIDGPVDLDEFNGRLEDVFNELKAQIADLQGKYQTLLNTAEAHVERINALEEQLADVGVPDYFTKEFGDPSVALNGIVDTPKGPALFWRLVTVAFRLAKRGKKE